MVGWKPHWKFQRYDLKFLEDPKGVFGGVENVHTLARNDLDKDMPEAYQILDKFFWTTDDMESITLKMEEGMEAEEAAQEWIDHNRDKVDQWLSIDE